LSAGATVLFSPNDAPQHHLIDLISKAKSRVHLAVYYFTSKKIALALIQAKEKHNVDVQCIIDESCLESRDNKIEFLKRHNIDVFLYPSLTGKATKKVKGIMHHKFLIIDETVVNGSLNLTEAGARFNKEDITIHNDKNILKKFEQRFIEVKQECLHPPKKVYSEQKNQEIMPPRMLRKVKSNLRYLFKKIQEQSVPTCSSASQRR